MCMHFENRRLGLIVKKLRHFPHIYLKNWRLETTANEGNSICDRIVVDYSLEFLSLYGICYFPPPLKLISSAATVVHVGPWLTSRAHSCALLCVQANIDVWTTAEAAGAGSTMPPRPPSSRTAAAPAGSSEAGAARRLS